MSNEASYGAGRAGDGSYEQFPGGSEPFPNSGGDQLVLPEAPQSVRNAFYLWIALAVVLLLAFVLGIVGASNAIDVATDKVLETSSTADLSPDAVRSGAVFAVYFAVIANLVLAALYTAFAFLMKSGRNWARIVLTVLAVLGILSSLSTVASGTGGSAMVIAGITIVVAVAALVFMWKSPSGAYFAARKRAESGL